jgi:hypothetical protein
MVDSANRMTPDQRDSLSSLADLLLPRTAEMPSASEIGIGHDQLDRVLAARPDLEAPLKQIADAQSQTDSTTTLELLRRQLPDQYRAFCEYVAGGYFMSRTVRGLINYKGQEAQPVDVYELPSYLEDGTLQRVVDRGPIFRTASRSTTDPDKPMPQSDALIVGPSE